MAQCYWLVLGFAQRNAIPEETGSRADGSVAGKGIDKMFEVLNARNAGRM